MKKKTTDNKTLKVNSDKPKQQTNIINDLEEEVKNNHKDEKYADDKIILKILKKGFESLSIEELAVTAVSPTFEHKYSIRTGEEWTSKYKAKALERLNFAKFNIQWNNRENTKAPFSILFDLIERGDVQRVTEYMKKYSQYNDELLQAVDNSKRSPLHIASKSGHYTLVSVLINKGYSIHLRDKFLRTPLHTASQMGHAKIVQLLIDSGSEIYARDSIGRTVMHYAASSGSIELVALLLSIEPELVHTKDCYNRSILHYIVWNSNPTQLDICKKILEQGIEVDSLDEEGMTALHYASDAGKGRIIPLLLKHGANPSIRDGRTQKTAYELALTEHIREILIVYSSKPHNLNEEDKKVLDVGVEGEKVNIDSLKIEEKRGRQRSKPKKETKKIESNQTDNDEQQYNNYMQKAYKEKLFELLKNIQEYGVKSMQHLTKPSLYSGSWMENIRNIENLNEYINTLNPTEAVLRVFNIIFPYDKPLPTGKGEETDMANFFNQTENSKLIQRLTGDDFNKNNKIIENHSNDEINNMNEKIKQLQEQMNIKSEQMKNEMKSEVVKYQKENEELKINSNSLKDNIQSLKENLDFYKAIITENKKNEESNKSIISELTNELKALRSEIFKNQDTEKIIYNNINNKSRFGVEFDFSLNEEKSIYHFLKLLEKTVGLNELLVKYDKDNDMHIFKNEMLNLLEEINLPLDDRTVIIKLAGFTNKNKMPIKVIMDNFYKREDKKNKALNELLFKIAYILHNKSLDVEKIYEFLNNHDDKLLDLIELKQGFNSLDILISDKDIELIFYCLINNYNKLSLDDLCEKLKIRKNIIDNLGNLDDKLRYTIKVAENNKTKDYDDISEIEYEGRTNKIIIDNKENDVENIIDDSISEKSSIVKSENIEISKIKSIDGELKIQVKSALNLVIPKSLPKPYTYCLTLSLDGANENKGYDSKEIITDDNFVTFNWAARIPLIKKNFQEVGIFFKIVLNIKGGNMPYIKLGECLVNWVQTIKLENHDKFVVDDRYVLNSKNKRYMGEVFIQAKFIPIGSNSSFYDSNGILNKLPSSFKGYLKELNNINTKQLDKKITFDNIRQVDEINEIIDNVDEQDQEIVGENQNATVIRNINLEIINITDKDKYKDNHFITILDKKNNNEAYSSSDILFSDILNNLPYTISFTIYSEMNDKKLPLYLILNDENNEIGKIEIILDVGIDYTEYSDSFKLELKKDSYIKGEIIFYLKFSIENTSDMNY